MLLTCQVRWEALPDDPGRMPGVVEEILGTARAPAQAPDYGPAAMC
ncbi:hypothetical protein J7E88_01265 [Streptomyces sp. ISL-10]|nr:hypothetical protein [Streptomyces sp. ISL-10]MBT2363994.1 hypothetical protein [Streptomyces sp. ISL-10]